MMTSPRALMASVLRPVLKALEGVPRPGPFHLSRSGGWLPPGTPVNFWQHGISPASGGERGAVVEACIAAYSQTVAMCPGDHWRRLRNGGRERVSNSALARVLKKPNDYESISDFLLNLTRSLYLYGNAYALCLRNERFEIDEMHLCDPRQSFPQIARATGDVFYQLGGNDVIEARIAALPENPRGQRLPVPARDVMHLKLNAFEHRAYPFPLVGQTPLVAAYGDLALLDQMRDQQQQFLQNRAAPSAVLQTDLNLSPDQVRALRDRWDDAAKGLHAGGVPILTHGLKVQPWLQPAVAKDMQIAELMKLTRDQIALVFRVPLAILGVQEASGSTTEQLYQSWLASGLGFLLNHLEEAFGLLFQLKGQPEEFLEFNTEALLRSARKERVEMLVRGVMGGLFSPNEARRFEDLPSVPFGEEPRVQAQNVPLSAVAMVPAAPVPPSAPAAPVTAATQDAVKRTVEDMQARCRKSLATTAKPSVASP